MYSKTAFYLLLKSVKPAFCSSIKTPEYSLARIDTVSSGMIVHMIDC